ncbi:hypothetical protein CASFOL_002381 [Castilleja foliolosa]|uniref:GMP synthase [glutamine-hydrolyzing] n=1 Tax=Castilleja foliolosa TaxID=1961234 RepID=A0ABD3EEE3_9LAMI
MKNGRSRREIKPGSNPRLWIPVHPSNHPPNPGLNVFSLCLNRTSPLKAITDLDPSVIILSGGPHSVHAPGAPCFAPRFLEYVQSSGVRVLGICYGLQLIVQEMGGEVRAGEKQEYGRMDIEVAIDGGLFGNKKVGDSQIVWMSHGDEAVRLPEGFEVVARSKQGAIAAVQNQGKGFYGLQYHPEVTHSQPEGMETLKYFLFDLCGITPGGVDSTVAATLVHKAIGDRLHCVFVDNGLLRWKERERVMVMFEKELHLPVTEPEKKRKIIGNEFINIFDAFAQELEKKYGKRPAYLVQGTLYPDVIESCPPPGSGRTHSHTIKSHHNVGGLPKDMKLKLIEPLKLLFKDEVRELGKIMGVPQGFLKRHPFPGPGLAVRVPGDVTLENRLDILRRADEIFIQAIKDAGIYDDIWQAFAVFMPVLTVGVQGDKRTHSYAITLRAVTSQDGMTADWYYFDKKFLVDLSSKICNEVPGVNRVLLDITSKPPSTIEWE